MACRPITILRTVTAGGSVNINNITKADNFIFLIIIAAETLAGARLGRTVMDRTFWMKTGVLLKVYINLSYLIDNCQARVRSPKVKTKRTWADTKITWAT